MTTMKLFQIYENDLATLEELLPKLCDLIGIRINTTASRIKVRRVKEILNNVRWNYGPHEEVHH